jgi:DCC1-like thiol-disulfide oxidoreductase
VPDRDRPLFIYDGDCGFCRKWAGWLEQRTGSTVRFSPFQAQQDLAHFHLTDDDVRSASYLITGAPTAAGAVSRERWSTGKESGSWSVGCWTFPARGW